MGNGADVHAGKNGGSDKSQKTQGNPANGGGF
jgi:hypothetical protein